MAAAKSPTGVRTDGVPGYSTMQVGRMVQKMCARGELFVAKLSHRNARYFSTAEAAKALTTQRVTVSVRKRLVPHSAWSDVEPAVIPEGLEAIELPTPPERYAPDPADASWKLFSACRIGEYPSPPSTWAEAVAA